MCLHHVPCCLQTALCDTDLYVKMMRSLLGHTAQSHRHFCWGFVSEKLQEFQECDFVSHWVRSGCLTDTQGPEQASKLRNSVQNHPSITPRRAAHAGDTALSGRDSSASSSPFPFGRWDINNQPRTTQTCLPCSGKNSAFPFRLTSTRILPKDS